MSAPPGHAVFQTGYAGSIPVTRSAGGSGSDGIEVQEVRARRVRRGHEGWIPVGPDGATWLDDHILASSLGAQSGGDASGATVTSTAGETSTGLGGGQSRERPGGGGRPGRDT